MKTRRQQTSLENSETIPNDLIIEIVLKLPAKSIARCRCVSKSWASIFRSEYFTELFMTRSRARPQLLFSRVQNRELFLFSIPQVQSQDVIAANYLMRFPCTQYCKKLASLRGLVCFQSKCDDTKLVICNPSTGQSLTLPHMKTKGKLILVNSFLGFDPVDKQFKLLSKTTSDYKHCQEFQVLTLGTQKLSWRMIECSISHYFFLNDGICINGVIYYVSALIALPHVTCIVCFDVRSEKFRVINHPEEIMLLRIDSTLVNYKGNLGALLSELYGETRCFELWVLVDAEKHKWSKRLSVSPPPLLKNIATEAKFNFVGLTGTHEIVLSLRSISEPLCLYVYYYSIESNTFRRVEIQGIDMNKDYMVHVYVNHVEDVKLLRYI